jgi:hypothetical protein
MADFGISGVEPLGSATRELVNAQHSRRWVQVLRPPSECRENHLYHCQFLWHLARMDDLLTLSPIGRK